jgi:DNA-binding NtrC family response regulator
MRAFAAAAGSWGCTFRVIGPTLAQRELRASCPIAPDCRVMPAAASPPSDPPRTILVIDDEEKMRDLLSRMLQRAGFSAVTAANGRDALERFRDGHIDAVVTDMVMPEMDGIEVIRAFLAERPGLPIIAVSGVHDWADYLTLATTLGARAGLKKPVRSVDLVRALRRCLK